MQGTVEGCTCGMYPQAGGTHHAQEGDPVMSPSCPLISVVVPAYNEIENLPELYRQLLVEFDKLDEELELLVVDDGSTDGTLDWLRAASQRDRRVKFMSFSRNFGHQAAIRARM